MTVDHVAGNSQTQWINSHDANSITESKNNEAGVVAVCKEKNSGTTCKMDETNGNLKQNLKKYEVNEFNKLKVTLCDVRVPENLPQNKENTNENEESDEEERQNDSDTYEDMKCGLGVFSPKWMQIFASKQAFLVTFCITWVLQGMYYTYFVSVITTIEKLFQIQSKTTGIIMSATEIGQIGSSLLLTYYGGQGHRPKWIAWGMVLFAVSSFMCALPHFIFGEQLIRSNDILYTGLSPNTDLTDETITPPNLCRSLYSDNYPPPMLLKDHLNFLKRNPNHNIRNSFLMLHSESQISNKLFTNGVNSNSYIRSSSSISSRNNEKHSNDFSKMIRGRSLNNNMSAIREINTKRTHYPRRYDVPYLNFNTSSNHSEFWTLKQDPSKILECEEDFLQEQRAQSKITQIVLTIFFISLLGVGMGQTAVYTLGIPYIDDNVATRESPLYFGKFLYFFKYLVHVRLFILFYLFF